MPKPFLLTTALLLGLVGVTAPAWADSSTEPGKPMPTMEAVLSVDRQDASALNQVAEQINYQLNNRGDDGLTTISDVIPASLLDGLLDEDGNVSLPLGLTVYDAMGATSIGFGSKF